MSMMDPTQQIPPEILQALLAQQQQLAQPQQPQQPQISQDEVIQTIFKLIIDLAGQDLDVPVKSKSILDLATAVMNLEKGGQQQGIPPQAQFELEVAKARHQMLLAQQDQQHRHQLDQQRLAAELAQKGLSMDLLQQKHQLDTALKVDNHQHKQQLAEQKAQQQAQQKGGK